MHDSEVRLRSYHNLLPWCEGTDHIAEYTYEILCNDEPAGEAKCYRFSREVDPESLIEEADEISDDVREIAVTLKEIEERIEPMPCDVLYLASIRLDKPHRGKELGLLVMETLIHLHGQSAHLILIACPLPERMVAQTAEEREVGRASLKRYWRRLGLKTLKGHAATLWHDCTHKETLSASQEEGQVSKSIKGQQLDILLSRLPPCLKYGGLAELSDYSGEGVMHSRKELRAGEPIEPKTVEGMWFVVAAVKALAQNGDAFGSMDPAHTFRIQEAAKALALELEGILDLYDS